MSIPFLTPYFLMLAVISPAKTLDFESSLPSMVPTQPEFHGEAVRLNQVLAKLNADDLIERMGISEKLADLNVERNRSWTASVTEDNGRAALFAFKGDVYTGFELPEYQSQDLDYAQDHLRILSGLYGILRPLDLIQPYRLEMGTGLSNPRGKNLYEFWGDRVTKSLNLALADSKSEYLINLASKEYSNVLQLDDIDAEIITPQFKQLKNGVYKFMSFYGKKARGMMSDFIIREKVTSLEQLQHFSREGYQFNEELSEGANWVFTRDEVPAK